MPIATTSTPLRFQLAACALAAALLSACGGGGGGDSSGGGNGSGGATAAVTAAPPAIITNPAVPAASYADAERQALYQQLNTLRLGVGAGLAQQNAQLDQSAAAHMNYLRLYGASEGHGETTSRTGATGATVGERATRAGYNWRLIGEDLAWGTSFTPALCLDLLLSSVYHLAGLMGEQRDMGVAFSEVSGGANLYGCVFNFGVQQGSELQLPAPGTLRAYPYSGQTGVATRFVPSTEQPNPMPDYATTSQVAGQPVYASLRAQGDTATTRYTVTAFALRDAAGNAVPARVIAYNTTGEGVAVTADPQSSGAQHLRAGDVFLVPLSPLAAASTYTVNFAGRNGSVPYAATWQFKTR